MQNFVNIQSTETLTNSRQELLNNDNTIMSCNSGTSFPTTNLQVGMLGLRTDLNQLFQLMDLTPTWKLIFDLNKTAVSLEYVDQATATKVNNTSVVTVATANKILQLDGNGNLPANITGNAASASSAPWSGLSGVPTTFTPPVATATVLGGVKQGSGCTIAADGTLSVPAPTAPVIVSQVPMWMRNFGDSSSGAYSSSGSFSLSGEYCYTTFTLNSGHTLTVPAPGILVIRATTSITIAGTISASAVGAPGGVGADGSNGSANGNTGTWGTGGGTGGGGGHDGTTSGSYYGGSGGGAYIGAYTDLSAITSGGAGGGNSQTGFAGATPGSNWIKMLVDQGIYPVGSGGGSGSVYSSGTSGAGGRGGGCIVLVAPTITFTGAINVSGGSGGGASSTQVGGGGGGGGGTVIMAAQSYASFTGSFTLTGGSSGSGNGSAKAGGAGGAGWYVAYTIS